jgi:non-histone protein 10
MNEVEEANDASRLRIQRITNSVEKLRLERAFLLEQLAKRTSTNVEDSEGSPSPPPTVSCIASLLRQLLIFIVC